MRSVNLINNLLSSQLRNINRLCIFPNLFRPIHTSNTIMASDEFNSAKDRVPHLKEEPDNDIKLQLYAFFKQATSGPNDKPKPGMMDFVGKAKWQAWSDLKDMDKNVAEKKYVELVNSLFLAESGEAGVTSTPSDSKFETLLAENHNGIYKITFNRPEKFNAVTQQMYEEIIVALNEAASDPKVKVALTTGAGDYYCSGNDLTTFVKGVEEAGSVEAAAKKAGDLLERFVTAFIDFPKPLLGVINGPAIGISVTSLGLYDAVFASDRATFNTPFTLLGQTAEGCSSYTFPRIMGPSQAAMMLMFNKKLTANEALLAGLVNEVIPHDSLWTTMEQKLTAIANLPAQALFYNKFVTREALKSELHTVNKRECEVLVGRWQSTECQEALMAFAERKSKM